MQYSPGGEAANTAADAKRLAPWSIDYELAPGLVKPVSKARAWKALLPTDARTRFTALARALGVRGEVVDTAADQIGIVDPESAQNTPRGDAPTMTMWVGGGPASWSYYPAAGAISSEMAPPCAPDDADCVPGKDTAVAPTTTMPKNLASTSQATVRAEDILRAAGYDLAALDIAATQSSWSTMVTFEEKVDGLLTGNVGGIDFGENAMVVSAWGQFAEYEGADTYPLIDLDDAVDRLSSGTWVSSMVPSGAMVKDEAATTTDSAPSPETPVSSDASAPSETVISGSPTTTAIARTEVVRITGVELALQSLYVSQSEVYLVPSYRFTDGDNDIGTVYAIPEKYISVAESPTPEPAPVEPAPETPGEGSSTPGSPGSGSSGSGSSGSSGGAVDPGQVAPLVSESDAKTLVGLAEDEAIKVAASKGWTARVVERDGESFMVTTDYRLDRVNLTVESGKVTSVSVG